MAFRNQPMVRIVPTGGGGGRGGGSHGIKCCCCTCCNCMDISYLWSKHGLFKLAELILGGLCQSLLVEYGLPEADSMGAAFHGFLTTVAACVLTTLLLIICYVISPKSQNLIRQSLFEFLFNVVACFLYLSAATGMAATVHIRLYPNYVLKRMYSAYPAMTAVYYIGAVVGAIHGVDAYMGFRFFRGYG